MLSHTDMRAVLSNVQSSVPVPKLPAEIEDRMIAGVPTGDVSIRIIRPRGVGEVNIDAGPCVRQANTIQLDIAAYWSG